MPSMMLPDDSEQRIDICEGRSNQIRVHNNTLQKNRPNQRQFTGSLSRFDLPESTSNLGESVFRGGNLDGKSMSILSEISDEPENGDYFADFLRDTLQKSQSLVSEGKEIQKIREFQRRFEKEKESLMKMPSSSSIYMSQSDKVN